MGRRGSLPRSSPVQIAFSSPHGFHAREGSQGLARDNCHHNGLRPLGLDRTASLGREPLRFTRVVVGTEGIKEVAGVGILPNEKGWSDRYQPETAGRILQKCTTETWWRREEVLAERDTRDFCRSASRMFHRHSVRSEFGHKWPQNG